MLQRMKMRQMRLLFTANWLQPVPELAPEQIGSRKRTKRSIARFQTNIHAYILLHKRGEVRFITEIHAM